MSLSPHFNLAEFEHGGPMPDEAMSAHQSLCEDILEHIRSRFDVPITISSGYRSPEHNQAVGGAATSQHVATAEHCAADIQMDVDLQVVFDWMRLSSGLPFDQIILERPSWIEKPACIHVSWAVEPRREALEGLTGGRSKYKVHQVYRFPDHDSPPEIWGES